MKVAVTGSSGLIGTALTASLRADGHEVVRLVRRPPHAADEIRWDPRAADAGDPVLTGVDACVHLAGAGVGDAPIGTLVLPEVVVHGPTSQPTRRRMPLRYERPCPPPCWPMPCAPTRPRPASVRVGKFAAALCLATECSGPP